jgi:hypothetical protein
MVYTGLLAEKRNVTREDEGEGEGGKEERKKVKSF